VTFQNRARVFGVVHQSGEAVRAQVLPLLDDFHVSCAKIGMLPTREVVLEVARLFQETGLPRPVVDPVILSSSGHQLIEEKALEVLIKALLPLSQLVTPNIAEAETFTGIAIRSEADMRSAAARIRELGAGAVLIKGGHLGVQEARGGKQEAGSRRQEAGEGEGEEKSEEAIDVLDNDGKVTVFRERRIRGAELHGSGCIMSAAIAAGLGKGLSLEESVGAAKSYVLEAIRNSPRRS
jgi:hydroxymethylpyrimidine/phosphomethylpyrimidine kinase